MKRTQAQPSSLAHALALLRRNRAWSQEDLARASGKPKGTLRAWENGARALKPENLEELAACMEYDRLQLEGLLFGIRAVVEPGEPPAGPRLPADLPPEVVRRARMEGVKHGLEQAREREARELAQARDAQFARERQRAHALVRRLLPLSPEQREALREREPGAGFYTWAFVERACEQSLRELPGRPEKARAWALLALHSTADPDQAVALRQSGYAFAFLANADRAARELEDADFAMDYSEKYWEWGEKAAALPLSEARRLELGAALRRDQGLGAEALALYERATQVSTPEVRPLLLLGQAETQESLGRTEAALESLLAARRSLGEAPRPDLRIRLAWKVADLLSRQGQCREALPYLDEARSRLIEARKTGDLALCLWVQARCDAGLRSDAEALKTYRRARAELTAQQRGPESVEVTLELAGLYLALGQPAPAQRLAAELGWTLKTPGLSRLARVYLEKLCQAAPTWREMAPLIEKGLAELRGTRPRLRP